MLSSRSKCFFKDTEYRRLLTLNSSDLCLDQTEVSPEWMTKTSRNWSSNHQGFDFAKSTLMWDKSSSQRYFYVPRSFRFFLSSSRWLTDTIHAYKYKSKNRLEEGESICVREEHCVYWLWQGGCETDTCPPRGAAADVRAEEPVLPHSCLSSFLFGRGTLFIWFLWLPYRLWN